MRTRDIEWPPGSGRVAPYTNLEARVIRDLADKSKGRHRQGCPARAGIAAITNKDGELVLEVEGCEGCRFLNEIGVLHEMKVVFGIDVAEVVMPHDPEVEPESLLDPVENGG